MKSRYLIVVALILVVLLGLPIVMQSTRGASGTDNHGGSIEGPVPTCKIIDRDTYDAPIKTQILIRAVVSGTITEPGLRKLLRNLHDEADTTREFKNHGGRATNIIIYLYPSLEHIKSGGDQWIAMLSRTGINSQIEISIKSTLIATSEAPPEEKHGLSETKRKEVFKDIGVAERRANTEAEQLVPQPDPSQPDYSVTKASELVLKLGEANNRLKEKYTLEVAEKYGLTQDQLSSIVVEGITKNWLR